MLYLEILWRGAREHQYWNIRREQGGKREPGVNDTVSVSRVSDTEQGTHARPDHPDVPSFARIGCALNIVFSPQRSAGQARYLRDEGCQFPVQDEPHAANACGRHLKALSSEEEAHRLRVTMIRPERNIPEVPRPSVRVYCIVSFNFRWREEAAHQGCRETMCLVCCMAPRERRRGGHLSVLTSLAVGDLCKSTLTRPP